MNFLFTNLLQGFRPAGCVRLLERIIVASIPQHTSPKLWFLSDFSAFWDAITPYVPSPCPVQVKKCTPQTKTARG